MEIKQTDEMIMVDLETRSTNIQSASIAQIGAVKFTLDSGVTSEFCVNVKHDPRFTRDPDTMKFWAEQPEEVRLSVFSNGIDIKDALIQFSDWIGYGSFNKFVWSHGKEFDVGILNNAYRVVEYQYPFNYPRTFDTRTIFAVAGVTLPKNNHNALQDCKNQVKLLQEIIS